MSAAQTRPGRPSLLTPELGERIAAELAGGARLGDAARACGISPRTLREWRQRAWSRSSADEPYVELERAIQHARVAVADRRGEGAGGSWQASALWLAHEDPLRWGPAIESLDDALGRVGEPSELP